MGYGDHSSALQKVSSGFYPKSSLQAPRAITYKAFPIQGFVSRMGNRALWYSRAIIPKAVFHLAVQFRPVS